MLHASPEFVPLGSITNARGCQETFNVLARGGVFPPLQTVLFAATKNGPAGPTQASPVRATPTEAVQRGGFPTFGMPQPTPDCSNVRVGTNLAPEGSRDGLNGSSDNSGPAPLHAALNPPPPGCALRCFDNPCATCSWDWTTDGRNPRDFQHLVRSREPVSAVAMGPERNPAQLRQVTKERTGSNCFVARHGPICLNICQANMLLQAVGGFIGGRRRIQYIEPELTVPASGPQ